MQQQLEEALRRLADSVQTPQGVHALHLAVYLLVGGVLALYIRWLFRTCANSTGDTEPISRTFPLLILVTTAVIAVVKSSLALSLGLVGALSIVRFRSAIKEPEELVYLFLCIAVGLALGAEQPLLAVSLVGVATLFVVITRLLGRSQTRQQLLVTITGNAASRFSEGDDSVFKAVESVTGRYTLQRCDVENGRGQVRLLVHARNAQEAQAVFSKMRQRLPDCELSCVNVNSQW